MIKKFEDWLNEGLWSKTLNRGRTDNKRLEDRNPQFEKYFETIKWVDMGHPDYLFAEYDYPGDEITGFVFKNLKFPKGISIMNSELYNWLLNTTTKYTILGKPGEKYYQRTSKITNEPIYFNINFDVEYTCGFDGNMLIWQILFGNNKRPFMKTFLKDNDLLTFKLVKEKRLNEGLWSKTLNRGRTGEKRLEEITDFHRYLKNVEWVDMGDPEYLFSYEDFPADDPKNLLSIQEIEEIIKSLPEDIEIMSVGVFDRMFKKSESFRGHRSTIIKNKQLETETKMYVSGMYWLSDDDEPMNMLKLTSCLVIYGEKPQYFNITFSKNEMETNRNGVYKDKKYFIKLMKKKRDGI